MGEITNQQAKELYTLLTSDQGNGIIINRLSSFGFEQEEEYDLNQALTELRSFLKDPRKLSEKQKELGKSGILVLELCSFSDKIYKEVFDGKIEPDNFRWISRAEDFQEIKGKFILKELAVIEEYIIKFNKNNINEEKAIKIASALEKLPDITYLDFANTGNVDNVLLEALKKNEHITNITGMELDEELKSHLKTNQALHQALHQADAQEIYSKIDLTGLSSDQIYRVMKVVSKNNNILKCEIVLKDITEEKSEIIAKALKESKTIESLSFYCDSNKNFKGMKNIVELLRKNSKITEFLINNTQISDDAAEELCKFLLSPVCKIKNLDITKCNFSKNAGFKITDMIRLNKSIINLRIGGESGLFKSSLRRSLLENHNIQDITSNIEKDIQDTIEFNPMVIHVGNLTSNADDYESQKESVIRQKPRFHLNVALHKCMELGKIDDLTEKCKKIMLGIEMLGSEKVFDLFICDTALYEEQTRYKFFKFKDISTNYLNKDSLKLFQIKLKELYEKTTPEEREELRSKVKKEIESHTPVNASKTFVSFTNNQDMNSSTYFSFMPKDLITLVSNVIDFPTDLLTIENHSDLLTIENHLRALLGMNLISLPNPEKLEKYKKELDEKINSLKLIEYIHISVNNVAQNNNNPDIYKQLVSSESAFLDLSKRNDIKNILKSIDINSFIKGECAHLKNYERKQLFEMLNFLAKEVPVTNEEFVKDGFKKIMADTAEEKLQEEKKIAENKQREENISSLKNIFVQSGMVSRKESPHSSWYIKYYIFEINVSEKAFTKLCQNPSITEMLSKVDNQYCKVIFNQSNKEFDQICDFLKNAKQPIDLEDALKWYRANIEVTNNVVVVSSAKNNSSAMERGQ